ncbi:LytR C-terminal domain-containing protein [Protaetiibacter intestinalis]|uniref:LytR family transcriptional regulator n=1 Tax=Protaetiibacter intestinalis TaxID=2419774 RepID=A0A387B6M2_9MICO|nr:LytR C-terminal domain-containing protein [Protaetiibacter intestinalis]AYF97408.1 LytR family transcriptional regulator [Protaetiibacter intestinalis]
MASFPRDQFDDLPRDTDRVGAHRAPGKRGRGWIGFGWAVLATAVLVVVGLFALAAFDSRFQLPIFAQPSETPTPTPTVIETADPVTDPATLDPAFLQGITISVLNGTPTQGLSATAADQIAAAGWPNPSRAAASATDETETFVYYGSAEYEGVARGIMQLIGAADVRLSDAFPTATITVVLGSDYVPPAAG